VKQYEADYGNLRAVDEFAAADRLDNDKDTDPDTHGNDLIGKALEDLRGRHLAFRRPEKCEECDLDELRLKIAMAVTESPLLFDYYREAWGVTSGQGAETTPPSAYRRIAVMQIALMVRAFGTLQLQRFANAPENRGWMNLFRQWGMSSRFNGVFDELKRTLPPDFVKFYQLYLRDVRRFTGLYEIMPIHHPWIVPADRTVQGRGVYMDSGLVEGEIEIEHRSGGPGDDPNSGPGADKAHETPSDSGKTGGGEPAPNE